MRGRLSQITRDPETSFTQAKEADLPLIITTTSDDGSVFKEFALPGMDPFVSPGLFEVAWPLYWDMSKPAFGHALFREMIFSDEVAILPFAVFF